MSSAALGSLRTALTRGLVIPAHPLAVDARGRLDERRQRALTRYYHAAGAGGLAVGVHTTQFSIREPQHALLEPVLALAAGTLDERDRATGRRTIRVAGVCGSTRQAVAEAELARKLGYDAGLLSLSALPDAADDALVAHAREVADVLPVFGFYLQPAVGGRLLSRAFWQRFVEIENVVAIKIAAFDRYRTLDVLLPLASSGRSGEIALYTGNDDSIVVDLVTTFELGSLEDGKPSSALRFAGGLLGHWAFGTQRAVELFERCRRAREAAQVPAELLTIAAQVTDVNAAVFDAAGGFKGCVPGIHEALRQVGLLESTRCLDPKEVLSPGQRDEITRVRAAYPHLFDDAFVAEHRDEWMG